MKNTNNFDESVKNKLDDMNFQFNEANWEKMSQMIDASRPAKKPFANIPVISSIVIGSALLIGSAWFFMSQTLSTKEVAQNNNTVTVASNNNSNSISENTTLNSRKINTSTDKNISNTNNDITTSNNNSNATSLNNNQTEVISSSEQNSSLNSNVTNKNIPVKKVNAVQENEFNAQSKTSSDPKENKTETLNSTANNVIGKAEGAHVKATGINTNDPISNTNNAITNNNSGNINKTELSTIADQPAIQQTATDPEETDIISLASTTTNLGQTEDAIAAANLKTAIEDKKVKEYVRVKHHTVNIEAGVSNSFGWSVNNTRNGNNISPVLGINYMYNIDSRTSLLAGLQYNGLSNLGEAKANFSITTFGFGVNNNVTTYKLNDLHYAVMPLKLVYKLNKSHSIGAGFNLMYLMNTRTEIINTTILESNLTTTESHYEYGYGFDQLNKFNVQLGLSYNYNISKTLGLNFELNKSLSNTIKDYSYFGIKNQNCAPAAVKLSLTYTLFNK
jgi:hypothetical protein